jgi:hypothetical protein
MTDYALPLYYNWHGVPVEVEPYGDNQEWDVSAIIPQHPTGTVPADETHYVIRLITSGNRGWWATEKTFHDHAEPVGPGALKREGEWER